MDINFNYKKSHADTFGLKIFEEDPEIKIINNALYIPRHPCLSDHDKEFGLYDCYGRLIMTAGPRRGWPNHSVGQSETSCVDPLGDHDVAPEHIYFYGGHIGDHFGHFITETLPRYWCERGLYQNAKIVVHSGYRLDILFSFQWVRELFSLIGLREENFVVFDRPTIIRTIIVAGSAFEENHFAHKAFSRFCNAIGDGLYPDRAGSGPIYLSRSRHQSGMRVFENETLLDEALEARGFEIVRTESLNIEQQIALFSAKRPICGFIGSAFHNSIFSRRPFGVALCHDDHYSSNFFLMDSVNKSNIIYLQSPNIHTKPWNGAGPLRLSIDDPQHLASFLDEIVAARAWEQNESGYKKISPDYMSEGEILYVKTAHGHGLYADKMTGIVRAKDNPDGSDCIVWVRRLNNAPFILLEGMNGMCLTVEGDGRCLRQIKYVCSPNGAGISLFNHEANRFLCAEPNGRVSCDRHQANDWERFDLIAMN